MDRAMLPKKYNCKDVRMFRPYKYIRIRNLRVGDNVGLLQLQIPPLEFLASSVLRFSYLLDEGVVVFVHWLAI